MPAFDPIDEIDSVYDLEDYIAALPSKSSVSQRPQPVQVKVNPAWRASYYDLSSPARLHQAGQIPNGLWQAPARKPQPEAESSDLIDWADPFHAAVPPRGNTVIRKENPALVNKLLREGMPAPQTSFRPWEIVQKGDLDKYKDPGFRPASLNVPDGSPRGKPPFVRLTIDVDQVRKSGGQLVGQEAIRADQRAAIREGKLGTSEPWERAQRGSGGFGPEGEVLVKGPVAPNAISKTQHVEAARNTGKFLTGLGVANTTMNMTQAAIESADTKSIAPIAKQAARETGGWGGARAGAIAGARFGMRRGPQGAAVGGVAGGVVGGWLGYEAVDKVLAAMGPEPPALWTVLEALPGSSAFVKGGIALQKAKYYQEGRKNIR